ncbi:MAG: hypothetical protein JOZ69_02330 [Myxococcales bacterium]|nr:hypothetical protein [Myxococcales bacterium]
MTAGRGGRWERALVVVTPVATMAAVALGLRLGAGSAVRAAVVYGAPPSRAGTGLAWQVVVFDEDHGLREPARLPVFEVSARAGGRPEGRFRGPTNEDGVAELLLALGPSVPADLRLEVRAAGALLAGGPAAPGSTSPPPAEPPSPWARFAKREGAVALDVAVVGQRAASGFPASIWVRASDAATGGVLAGTIVELESDASLAPAGDVAHADARGWAHLFAVPMGYAVPLILHAHALDGRSGTWAGGLFVSPGASRIVVRDRYAPGESPDIDVVVPNVRTIVYLEIDDAWGRAWAAALPVAASPDGGLPRASTRAPRLAPGLYWAVAAGDPAGAAGLGPGTIARPFFVADSDRAALTFGTDPDACGAGADDEQYLARAVARCLALAAPRPVPRWTAIDGFAAAHARDAGKRTRGLAVALGAIGVAVALEAVLLVRAARGGAGQGRTGSVATAILVALLGFLLLAAFLARVA